jgi:hypothetical protein
MEEYRFLFCIGLIIVLTGTVIYLLKELAELKYRVWDLMRSSKVSVRNASKVSVRNDGEQYFPIWHTVEFYPQEKTKKK